MALPDSSVGRATDSGSVGPRFEPLSGSHFYAHPPSSARSIERESHSAQQTTYVCVHPCGGQNVSKCPREATPRTTKRPRSHDRGRQTGMGVGRPRRSGAVPWGGVDARRRSPGLGDCHSARKHLAILQARSSTQCLSPSSFASCTLVRNPTSSRIARMLL